MKRTFIIFLCLINSTLLFSQEKMYIHQTNITEGALISETDSIYFPNEDSVILSINDNEYKYAVSGIDSILFGDDSETIIITYGGSSVSVINPLSFEGVSVAVDGADVVVTSTLDDRKVDYQLSGSTGDGMFKIYSDYKYNLILNGVSITNNDGPAINIQSGKKCSLTLEDGTENSLTDGDSYADSDEDQKAALFSEGQIKLEGSGSLTVRGNYKHAICSDDYIKISEGSITISGAEKDGIHATDYFEMSGGSLNITSDGDGIDVDGYVLVSDGEITTLNPGDDINAISSDSITTISGGTINLTVSGNQSKGLRAKQEMYLEGGNITINTSGDVALEASGSGYDPSYCSAIKCKGNFYATGSNVTIKSTGIAGKGISCDEDISITSGKIDITTTGNGATYTNEDGEKDAYNATCITSDGNTSITGGTFTNSSSGSGGKGISADGTLTLGESDDSMVIDITTSGSEIQISRDDATEAKAIKADDAITINTGTISISSNDDGIKSDVSVTVNGGDLSISNSVEGIEAPYITINDGNISVVSSDDALNATYGTGGERDDGSYIYIYGGYVVLNASKGDGLDSNGSVLMNDGTVIIHGPRSSPEVGIDVNGTFKITGGFLVASGPNSNQTEGPSSSSSQNSVIITTNRSLSSSTLFHIQDASGSNLLTFKPSRSYAAIVFSSSSLTKGSTYYIYTGGSCSGTENDGLYADGTYSGGTKKKSFTISGSSTKVSF